MKTNLLWSLLGGGDLVEVLIIVLAVVVIGWIIYFVLKKLF